MKYTNRADLLIAAGESIKMQEKAGIEPVLKIESSKSFIRDWDFTSKLIDYEFPLAVVEGKPVFVGDELYHLKGHKYIAQSVETHNDGRVAFRTTAYPWIDGDWISNYSWNPPKPKTVMVELLREDAELIAASNAHCPKIPYCLFDACRKALEEQ